MATKAYYPIDEIGAGCEKQEGEEAKGQKGCQTKASFATSLDLILYAEHCFHGYVLFGKPRHPRGVAGME